MRPGTGSARAGWLRRVALLMAAAPLLLTACGGASGTTSPVPTAAAVSEAPSPSAAPASIAQAPSPTPAPTGAFHLVKSCTGYNCTVTVSSYKGIPVGSKIHYTGDNNALSAVITTPGGTATGICNIATLPGSCSFTAGTGTLAKFHEDLVVTQDADGLWIWDGPLAS